MSLYTKIIDLQKLNQAWERIKKNKPSAGVDNVTYEDFENNKRAELAQLNIELKEHRYEALPVRNVTIYKGEKARVIALYSMRDKVVQQSLASELTRIYDNQFSTQTYAYRPNKSALTALDEIDKRLKSGRYKYFLKVDIASFFDTIKWNVLKSKLIKNVLEEDVLTLIEQNARTRVLDETGEISEKYEGIHQGSAIAPVLSNIYLMEFDKWLENQNVFFIRYSDDCLLLGDNKGKLIELAIEIRKRLQSLGLDINEKKTVLQPVQEKIEFLGYAFDQNGKSIPEKATENLNERLEIMWLTSEISFEEKLKKTVEIIGGWEQYFREERTVKTIFEYVALVAVSQTNLSNLKTLVGLRKSVNNIYKDIAEYLSKIWRDIGEFGLELFEYEQYFQLDNDEYDMKSTELLLGLYRQLMVLETEELQIELMQTYTDMRQYEKASFWMDRKEKSKKNEVKSVSVNLNNSNSISYDNSSFQRIIRLFAGREDIYSKESICQDAKRQLETELLPITEQVVRSHLEGNITAGTFIQRPNNTVKFIVVDIDISKKIMIQYERSSNEFKMYLQKAYNKAQDVIKLYNSWGLSGYIEFSGCRGYHVWLLFTEWIPVRFANMFCDVVERNINDMDSDISIEFFPNKTKIKPGKYGQVLKLPFGLHPRTGEQSYFVDDSGNKCCNINEMMDGMARFQLAIIKKILAANTELKDTEVKSVDDDISEFGVNSGNVAEVLNNCTLMRYLCQKARKTGYLSHFERLSLLYVFGHLGDDGQQFIHKVMSMTLNYQYNVTEKFISKIPAKPISCVKLREQYKSITAEYGCSCSFKRTKNCYPSPVLHAIALSNDNESDITVPTSKTLTKENEKKVIDELNIHKKAQELATKILDMKKQKRKIDASIFKLQNELCRIYDEEKIDCLEIEMGLLVRRKKDDGYEWIIEI